MTNLELEILSRIAELEAHLACYPEDGQAA